MKTPLKEQVLTIALIAAIAAACFGLGFALGRGDSHAARQITVEEMRTLEAYREWIATHGELRSVPPQK